ncbi:MAG: hypothetical protein H0X41_02960 [Chitinophagaceae bacterium]|nr:hypothetical protein [Chitinophagaceae bacterium]
MKPVLSLITFTLLFSFADAQYYYKDILVPQQASRQIAKYKEQKVRSVRLSSFESDGEPTEKFKGSQEVDKDYAQITTNLQSALAGSSQLVSNFNAAGLLGRSSDTTDGSGSTTIYSYTASGELSKIMNVSVSAGAHKEKEEHIWNFRDGKPAGMLRIKDNTDTTFIKLVLDDKGNVAEENSIRNKNKLPSYYYYYDDQNRLTDIVSYNIKARRLLPDYVFEYNTEGLLQTMMVVPEGSSDYQKWYYEYSNGLKTRETAFNKKKQLLGKIEYHYE